MYEKSDHKLTYQEFFQRRAVLLSQQRRLRKRRAHLIENNNILLIRNAIEYFDHEIRSVETQLYDLAVAWDMQQRKSNT